MKSSKFMQDEYGLDGNPFLDDIARREWLGTWVDRDEELADWRRVIAAAASPTKNYIVLLIANYGRGKTLSLLKVVSEADKHEAILTAYLTFKGEEKPRNPGLDFIFRIFKSVDFNELGANRGEGDVHRAIEGLPDDLEEVKVILRKIYSGDDELSRLGAYFLRGEVKGLQSQLRKLGVMRRIEDVEIGKEYLAGVLGFIRGLGFRTLLLAVDELEYLFSLVPRTQQGVYLALLRGLYDFPEGFSRRVGAIAHMAFFLAISEDGWRNLEDMEKREATSGGPIRPLLDRVDSRTVLGAFDKAQTRQLIEKRLSYSRAEGRYLDEPLIPFTEDFVAFIFEETQGEPRHVIVRCGHVLDAGLEKRIARLDKEFAQQVLQERAFI